jgi:hypothetical protein
LANRLGLGKPKSLRNVLREDLSPGKSSHHAQALAYGDVTTLLNDEAKQDVVMHLRDHLPELMSYKDVAFDLNNNDWRVDIQSSRFPSPMPLPAFIAGCPVHIHGDKSYHPHYKINGPGGWGTHSIYTRDEADLTEAVPDEAVWLIAKAFPGAHSFRVLSLKKGYGCIDILYSSFKQMDKDIERGNLPHQICDLFYDLKVVDVVMAGKRLDQKQDPSALLDKYIKDKKAFVVGHDYIFDRERSIFTKAILSRSDVDAMEGRFAWQHYSGTTRWKCRFGSKASVFNYKATIVS